MTAQATDRLAPLLSPVSIGIAGYSMRPGTWGKRVWESLEAAQFGGRVVAVEPRGPIEGVEYATLDDLGHTGGLDLLVVAQPAETVVPLVSRAISKGVRSVLILSSGFGEAGGAGAEMERELGALARDVPILGPNCLGLVNKAQGATVTATRFFDRPRTATGSAAIVSQSGAFGFIMADLLERRGGGFSFYVSTGNEIGVTAAEAGAYLLRAPEVSVLAMYVEGVRDVDEFASLGQLAHSLNKGVVALKGGRSRAGARAVLSHTAAIAGDAILFEALCRDSGVVVATNDEELTDYVLAMQRPVSAQRPFRIAIMSNSGGAAAVLSDVLEPHGIDVPALPDDVLAKVSVLGLPTSAQGNPVDLGGQFERHLTGINGLIDALASEPSIDGIVLLLTFGDQLQEAYVELGRRLAAIPRPTWMLWAGAPEGSLRSLPVGFVFPTIASLTRAISCVLDVVQPGPRLDLGGDASSARLSVQEGKQLVSVTEADAHTIFAKLGVPYVRTIIGTNVQDVEDRITSDAIEGPFVAKIDSVDAPHRSKAGLVEVGVQAAKLGECCHRLLSRARDLELSSPRLIVQPAVRGYGELSIGGLVDRQYGRAVLVGEGGTKIEQAGSAMRAVLWPPTAHGLNLLINHAVRRFPSLDPLQLRSVLLAAARVFELSDPIESWDLNPLLIQGDGSLLAVDSLIVLRKELR